MFKYLVIILCFFVNFELQSKESLLTLKQQLDRLQREVSDLSQSVFKESRDKTNIKEDNNSTSNLTAFDLRIYDLEKDIKTLNQNFEELIFQIDDLKKLYEELNLNLSTKLLSQNNDDIKDSNKDIVSLDNSNEILTVEDKNILGTLVINSEDLTDNSENKSIDNTNEDNNISFEKNMNPEQEFQNAFDLIRNQQFSDAKKSLQKFIEKYQDDKLVGSAHYWLGEIYLLKKEYREAALTFAEGYQNFPLSFKAPDMLYKLSDSLHSIEKKNEACSTLEKLIKEFPKNKLAFKAKTKLVSFNCVSDFE